MARRHVMAYFIWALGLVAGQLPKYALKGLEVQLMPSIHKQPDDILWKHNGNKVVDFDQQQQQVFKPYENRVTLDWATADLTITHLTYEDSGDYELEITIAKALHRSNYKLVVIDKVAKPTISCEMIAGSGSDKPEIQATLMCSAESSRLQSLMKLEWSSRGNVQPGPNLTISLGGEHDDEVYTCSVSNPLTNDKATFTAKDCYPEKSSSIGLIVGLVILFAFIALLLFLGFIFRKKLAKALPACCEKGKRGDLEKHALPVPTEGLDKDTSQSEETDPFLDRKPTLPSKQRLRQLVQMEPNDSNERKEAKHSDPDTGKAQETVVSDPPPPEGYVMEAKKRFEAINGGETTPKRLPASTRKGKNADKPELPPCDSSHSEEENKPDFSEDMQSDVQSSAAPEPTESEKEADEEEEAKSAPASVVSPPPRPPRLHPPTTQSSPHMAPKDINVYLKENANSDQVTGETTEKNLIESVSADDSSEEKQSSTVPDRKDSETTAHEQDSHLAHGETDTREDNQQETDKPVSGDEKESDGVGDQEAIDKAQNESVPTCPQPQSATLTTPDNSNTNNCQESPDTAQAEPEQEGKTTHDSDEFEGQPDSSTAEEDKGEGQSVEEKKEVQCGRKEESQAT